MRFTFITPCHTVKDLRQECLNSGKIGFATGFGFFGYGIGVVVTK